MSVTFPALLFIVFLGNYGAKTANTYGFFILVSIVSFFAYVETYIKFFTCFEDFSDYTNL